MTEVLDDQPLQILYPGLTAAEAVARIWAQGPTEFAAVNADGTEYQAPALETFVTPTVGEPVATGPTLAAESTNLTLTSAPEHPAAPSRWRRVRQALGFTTLAGLAAGAAYGEANGLEAFRHGALDAPTSIAAAATTNGKINYAQEMAHLVDKFTVLPAVEALNAVGAIESLVGLGTAALAAGGYLWHRKMRRERQQNRGSAAHGTLNALFEPRSTSVAAEDAADDSGSSVAHLAYIASVSA